MGKKKKKKHTERVGTHTLSTASQSYVLPEIRKREIEELRVQFMFWYQKNKSKHTVEVKMKKN